MDMRRLLRGRHRDQRGSTLLTFTLMIVALLALASMAVDAGLAYWNQRLLQNGMDAAALAGATHLPLDPDQAKLTARTYANHNGVTNSEVDAVAEPEYKLQVASTYNTNDTIIISARRNFDAGLRYLVGAGDLDIVATAAAIVVAKEPSDITPFGVTQNAETSCAIGAVCQLKVDTTDSTKGNFHLIDFPGYTGGQGVQDAVMWGYEGTVPPPVATTTPLPGEDSGEPVWDWQLASETGGKLGKLAQGIEALFDWDATKSCPFGPDNVKDCPTFYNVTTEPDKYLPSLPDNMVCYDDLRCPRVVLVPFITNSWSDANGKNTVVQITNFGCFYILKEPAQGGTEFVVEGMFVKYCNDSPGNVVYDWPIDTGSLHTRTIQVMLWH